MSDSEGGRADSAPLFTASPARVARPPVTRPGPNTSPKGAFRVSTPVSSTRAVVLPADLNTSDFQGDSSAPAVTTPIAKAGEKRPASSTEVSPASSHATKRPLPQVPTAQQEFHPSASSEEDGRAEHHDTATDVQADAATPKMAETLSSPQADPVPLALNQTSGPEQPVTASTDPSPPATSTPAHHQPGTTLPAHTIRAEEEGPVPNADQVEVHDALAAIRNRKGPPLDIDAPASSTPGSKRKATSGQQPAKGSTNQTCSVPFSLCFACLSLWNDACLRGPD
jgi:hypothetical protein